MKKNLIITSNRETLPASKTEVGESEDELGKGQESADEEQEDVTTEKPKENEEGDIVEPEDEHYGVESSSNPSLEDRNIPYAEEATKVVGSLSEFRAALTDHTTTTVYLNTDISVPSGGITINPDKSRLIIDGRSPVDGTVHSITDFASSAYSDPITLRTNSTLKSILVRNVIIYGKNYYGTVCIYDAVLNVTVTYDNIQYYGPQLTYNINGTAHYKDSYVEIGKFGGTSPANELAEAKNVIFEGNTSVTQVEGNINEIIYSVLPGTVEVLANSKIIIRTYMEGGFFYGASSTNFIIHEGADFDYYGPKRFWENLPFKNVTVNPRARLYIDITSGLAYNALLRVDGSLYVESESELILINRGSSSFWTVNMNGGNAYFRNPKRVVLYSSGIRPLYYGTRGGLSINAQQVRYWSTAAALPYAGGFDDDPKFHWVKPDDVNIEINGTIAYGPTGNFTSLTTNYSPPKGGNAINDETFHMVDARVLAFGRLPLTAEYVPLNESGSKIMGLSEPGSNIRISFTNEDGTAITLTATADANGRFQVPLNYTIKDDAVITVKSNKQFLTSVIQITVKNDSFQFHMTSSNIEFETTYLSHETKLVRRNDPDWGIVVTDGRGTGSTWSLTALLLSPLSYTDELMGVTYTLEDALVFIDGFGNVNTLTTDSETFIKSHTTTSDMDVTTIAWGEDRGILALIKPKTAHINIPYTGSILWILNNAP